MFKQEKIESIQSITPLLIFITMVIFAYGFAYQRYSIMLVGMIGLGITLIIHAPLSLITLSRWEANGLLPKIAFWGETFFAVGQLIFGVFAIVGAIAEIMTDYLSSGRFWQQVSQYHFLFIFVFGAFCSFVGISHILTSFTPAGDKLSHKLSGWKDFVQGIVFLIFGLFFIGLIVYVKLF